MGCYEAGINGLCGIECPAFLVGDCDVYEDAMEDLCSLNGCEHCLDYELCEVYNWKCKTDNETMGINKEIIITSRDFDSLSRDAQIRLSRFSNKELMFESIECDEEIVRLREITGI